MVTLSDDLEEILELHCYGSGGICLDSTTKFHAGCGWKATTRRAKHGGYQERLDVQHRRHVAAVLAAAVDQAIAGALVHLEDQLRREYARPTPTKVHPEQQEDVLW